MAALLTGAVIATAGPLGLGLGRADAAPASSDSTPSVVVVDTTDLPALREAVAAVPGGGPVQVSPRLEFGVSLSTESTGVFVIGVEPTMGSVLGVGTMKDDVAYGALTVEGPQTVFVPVVSKLTDTGGESNHAEPFSLTFESSMDPSVAAKLGAVPGPDKVFVTSTTFWKIAEIMLSKTPEQLRADADARKEPMMPLITAAYVYSEDSGHLQAVVDRLDDEGFTTAPVVSAANETDGSLGPAIPYGLRIAAAVTTVLFLALVVFLAIRAARNRQDTRSD